MFRNVCTVRLLLRRVLRSSYVNAQRRSFMKSGIDFDLIFL